MNINNHVMNQDNPSEELLSPPKPDSGQGSGGESLIISRMGFNIVEKCLMFAGVGMILFVGGIYFSDRLLVRCPVPREKLVMANVRSAVQCFYTEYGRYPLPVTPENQADVRIETRGRLLDALLGKDDELNPQKIEFYDPSDISEQSGETQLLDPWGNPYVVVIDTDNDGRVANPEWDPKGIPGHYPEMFKLNVIVYSGGPDGNLETWKDNACSWR